MATSSMSTKRESTTFNNNNNCLIYHTFNYYKTTLQRSFELPNFDIKQGRTGRQRKTSHQLHAAGRRSISGNAAPEVETFLRQNWIMKDDQFPLSSYDADVYLMVLEDWAVPCREMRHLLLDGKSKTLPNASDIISRAVSEGPQKARSGGLLWRCRCRGLMDQPRLLPLALMSALQAALIAIIHCSCRNTSPSARSSMSKSNKI
jgi:hypothetical protein